jgi:hypothetical protein
LDIENEERNRRERDVRGGVDMGAGAVAKVEAWSESMSLNSSSSRADSRERSRRPGELGGRCTGFWIVESRAGVGGTLLSMMGVVRIKDPVAVKQVMRSVSAANRIDVRAAT